MSSTITSAANIIGAMFAIRNALMIVPPRLRPHWLIRPLRCPLRGCNSRLESARRRSWLLLPADADALDFLSDRQLAARAQNLLGKQFLGRLFDVFFTRVGDHSAQECKALDQFRHGLDDQ